MPRLNIYETIPLFAASGIGLGVFSSNGALRIRGVYIPGSISFNQVAVVFNNNSVVANSLSISFGLYSLSNNSTLNLANSASFSSTYSATIISWLTLATSATQDITPGNWYFGVVVSQSNHTDFGLLGNTDQPVVSVYGGPAMRGQYRSTTNNIPSTIHTSDILKDDTAPNQRGVQAYVLISA